MGVERREIDNLAEFLKARGGVVNTFAQAGRPVADGVSLMAARCAEDGQKLPTPENVNNFQQLVAALPPKPGGA